MAPEKQRRIFISYSRINKEFAVKLASELRSAGFPVWLDQLDIPPGARWDDEVESALQSCEIFLIILTPASMASENVKDEIGYAIDARKRILPLLLENADLPLRLRRFQYVDFTSKSFEEGVDSAKQLLGALMALPTDPEGKKRSGELISQKPGVTQDNMKEDRVDKKQRESKVTSKTNIKGDQNIMSGQASSGGIIVQGGRGNVVTVHQFKGADAKELTALFTELYWRIESRPPDPNIEKEEITETVKKIEVEVSKGEEINQTKLGRWMENLNKMAPDIIDVFLASLGGPVSGAAAILKKVADRARQQSQA